MLYIILTLIIFQSALLFVLSAYFFHSIKILNEKIREMATERNTLMQDYKSQNTFLNFDPPIDITKNEAVFDQSDNKKPSENTLNDILLFGISDEELNKMVLSAGG